MTDHRINVLYRIDCNFIIRWSFIVSCRRLAAHQAMTSVAQSASVETICGTSVDASSIACRQRIDGTAAFPGEGRRPRRTPKTSLDQGWIPEGL